MIPKINNNFSYSFFDTFVLRTPSLSFNSIDEFTKSEESLITFIHSPYVQEAIYIASPILYEETLKLLNKQISDSSQQRKILRSLTKYLLRMSSRCTPFGLFAGCSTGKFGNRNEVSISTDQIHSRNIRLDMSYLCKLYFECSKTPSIRNHLKFYPNNSIYFIGKELRYVFYSYDDDYRKYRLASTVITDCLIQSIELAKNGVTINELINSIQSYFIDGADLERFVNELISSQILISELEPKITGGDFLDQLLTRISNLAPKDETIILLEEVLQEVSKLLEEIKITSLTIRIPLYKLIVSELRKLNIPFEESKLFQVDLSIDSKVKELKSEIGLQIFDGIKLLCLLHEPPVNNELENFKIAFYERYIDEEIPLSIALDPETGIGYPTLKRNRDLHDPLIEDLIISPNREGFEITWTKLQSHLLNKYLEALKENRYELCLTESELAGFKNYESFLPNTFSAIVQIYGENEHKDNLILLKQIGGASATEVIGRFCHIDQNILDLAKEISSFESFVHNNAVIAEIIHLPQSRVGNILQRPVLTDFEIPYMAKAAVHDQFQLGINDLFISLRNNRITLRSKQLKKEIIPRLSSAHNFDFNSLPIYRFLCDLQCQDKIAFLGYNWGLLSGQYKFLPRVIYQNLILSRASWNFVKSDYKDLIGGLEHPRDVINNWRNQFRIPRFIALVEGDNELVVDLENTFCINVFIDEIKNKESIKVVEFLSDSKDFFIQNSKLRFAGEFIISFKKSLFEFDDNSNQGVETLNSTFLEKQRHYYPGEEWLYYKLYCGRKVSDQILKEVLLPLLKELQHEQIIEKWFFLRYEDPNYHLRIRLKIKNKLDIERINSRFMFHSNSLNKAGFISKLEISTYDRELERYGIEFIDYAESIFSADSQAMVFILKNLEKSEDKNLKWLICLKSVDQLLSDFNLNMEEKYQFTLENTISLSKRQQVGNKHFTIQMGKKYRSHKIDIEKMLSKSVLDKNSLILHSIINQRSWEIQSSINEICAKCEKRRIVNYLQSYIHMSVNRLFSHNHNLYEVIIYDFLSRYYKTSLQRSRFSGNLS